MHLLLSILSMVVFMASAAMYSEQVSTTFPSAMESFNGSFGGSMVFNEGLMIGGVCAIGESSVRVYYQTRFVGTLDWADHGCESANKRSVATAARDQSIVVIGDPFVGQVKLFSIRRQFVNGAIALTFTQLGSVLTSGNLSTVDYAFGHSVKAQYEDRDTVHGWLAVSAPKRDGSPGVVNIFRSEQGTWDPRIWTLHATIEGISGLTDGNLAFAIPLEHHVMVAFGTEINGVRCVRSAVLTVDDDWLPRGNPICGNSDSDGTAVALNKGGNIMAVSWFGGTAPRVRVYFWDDKVWTQRGADLVGAHQGDGFGWSIDLSNNGNTLIIGSPFNNEVGVGAGRADVFVWVGGKWTQKGDSLYGLSANHKFGWSVSTGGYDDSTTSTMLFAVSAPGHHFTNSSNHDGVVRQFIEKNPDNTCASLGQYGVGGMPPCAPCPYGYTIQKYENKDFGYDCVPCIGSRPGCAGESVIENVDMTITMQNEKINMLTDMVNQLNATLNALLGQDMNNRPSAAPSRRVSRRPTMKPSKKHYHVL